MIVQQIFPEETVNAALEKVQQRNKNLQGQTLASLITSQSVPKDPRFLMNNGFQAPLQARIGFKLLF